MEIKKHLKKIPVRIRDILEQKRLTHLRPCQIKAIDAGLFDGRNILVCTPTASGKTLVAEMAAMHNILESRGKAVYVVPLKALASEKYRDFKSLYGDKIKIVMSVGDTDSGDPHLARYDLIITTSEKLDSLIRHHCPWLRDIGCVIVDEIHLLDDASRGPTLEILITVLRKLLKEIQIIALSATIGNPQALADWLGAELVIDSWRPVKLYKGVYFEGVVRFYE